MFLVTDLTPEESGEFEAELRANGLDMIFLVAPTSTDERLKLVAQRASGFIYAVSRAGVTGTQITVSAEAEKTGQSHATVFRSSDRGWVWYFERGAGEGCESLCGCGCGWFGDRCGDGTARG